MHIGRQNPGHTYVLDGKPMQVVREEKDLGIVIDGHLRLHKQTVAAISEASQMLAVVRRSFGNLNEGTLPLLYRTVARPFLEYVNTIWGPFGKVDQMCLELVQRWHGGAISMMVDTSHIPSD